MTKQETFDRSIPPISATAPPEKFPDAKIATLSNGVKIIIHENHDTPLVNLKLYTKTGSVHDGEKIKSASFAYALLMQGTENRSSSEIANEIERLGADMSAAAGTDSSSVTLSLMTKYLDKGLDLMQDIALHPLFAENELEFVRKQSLNRLQFSKSDGAFLASQAFNQAVYQSHPYGNPSIGTEAGLKALTKNDIQNFYSSRVIPNESFITVAGDVDPDSIVKKLESVFGSWKKIKNNEINFPKPSRLNRPKVILVQKDGAVQSTLHIGHLAIERNHPDYITLYVLNMVFGGFFGSRLNMNIREKQGFTYGVRSSFDALKIAGDFSVEMQVRNEVTGAAISELLKEIHDIRSKQISVEELQTVKNYVSGNFVIQNEQPQSIAGRFATAELYDLGINYYKSFQKKIHAVTLEDVENAAKKYILPDELCFVISGDSNAIRKQVESFGEITIQDADGNEIQS